MGPEIFVPKENWHLPEKGIAPIEDRIDKIVEAIGWATKNRCLNLKRTCVDNVKINIYKDPMAARSWKYYDQLYLTDGSLFNDTHPLELLELVINEVVDKEIINLKHPLFQFMHEATTLFENKVDTKQDSQKLILALNDKLQMTIIMPRENVTAFAIGFTPEEKDRRIKRAKRS